MREANDVEELRESSAALSAAAVGAGFEAVLFRLLARLPQFRAIPMCLRSLAL